jgi:hypothetical protein
MNTEQIIASLEKSLEENKTLFFNALSHSQASQAEKAIKSIERRIVCEKEKTGNE